MGTLKGLDRMLRIKASCGDSGDIHERHTWLRCSCCRNGSKQTSGLGLNKKSVAGQTLELSWTSCLFWVESVVSNPQPSRSPHGSVCGAPTQPMESRTNVKSCVCRITNICPDVSHILTTALPCFSDAQLASNTHARTPTHTHTLRTYMLSSKSLLAAVELRQRLPEGRNEASARVTVASLSFLLREKGPQASQL